MRRKERNKINQHMKRDWPEEIVGIRQCIMEDNVLSSHILKRIEERDISIQDLAAALMQGEIVEGFDVLTYPRYRNQHMLRTIEGKDLKGRTIRIGVAIHFPDRITLKVVKLTTTYVKEMDSVETA